MRVVGMVGSLPTEFGGEGRGGVAVHTGKLAQALTKAGEAVTVVADDAGPPTHSRAAFPVLRYELPSKIQRLPLLLARDVLRGGDKRHHVSSLRWLDWLRTRAFTPVYDDLISRLSPDLLHIHGTGLRLLALHRAVARTRAPLVATLHSLRGHVPDAEFFARSVPSLFLPDALITVSRYLKAEAIGYGVSPAKLHVVPNGVDRTSFFPIARELARRELGIPPEARVILLVAHLIERKGADIAVRAMAQVVPEVPEARLFLVGAAQGYTDAAWKQRLLDLPALLGIGNSVVFAGDVPGHADGRLNQWYNAADIVVLPSRAEGMGMVIIEAMACRKPVIGARVGGIPDVIRDGSNGLLVPAEDPQSLAAAIVSLLRNPELYSRLAAAGYEYAVKEHDWGAIAERTREIYDEVLMASPSGRRTMPDAT